MLDLAIIGAGPIGLEVAVAAQRAGLDYVVIDAGQIGQTICWFPYQMRFFSSTDRIAIAGVPIQTADQSKCSREEYLAYLRSIVGQFDLRIRTYEPVESIEREKGDDANGFVIHSRSARGVHLTRARNIVLATGDTDSPRRLGIPGEDLPHVSHQFVEPHRYFRRRLLVVGGKNSAVEAALRCYHAGAHVTISYRSEAFDDRAVKYWLLPEVKGRIARREIDCFYETQPTRITPTHVTLRQAGGGEVQVEADFVLVLIGFTAEMSLFSSVGVELRGEGRVPTFDEQTMMTNVPGVYVAGTATAGTQQSYHVFLENCHVHARRIIASITGHAPPQAPSPQMMPES